MPVNEIHLRYSDKLKYNEQLSDWRTHNGIDIAANTGCSVQAAADSVIDETGKTQWVVYNNNNTQIYQQNIWDLKIRKSYCR